jgi:proteasome lid subunit RPN8/RPN11
MEDNIKIQSAVIKMIIELAKEKYPEPYICKLLVKKNVIYEISIFSNLGKNIPEVKSVGWTVVSALSYGPYLEKFAVSPDFIFETEFIGFALSHTDESFKPTDEDKKLFSHRGEVHVITAPPFDEESWAAYDSNGNRIQIQVIG